MMNTVAGSAKPYIETLLAAMHHDLAALEGRRDALERAGIARDHLPDEVALMAFALLGNHEREVLVAQLRPHWATLESKGCVYGAINEIITPLLRLLAHALPHANTIDPLGEQLRNAGDAPAPPSDVWRCAAHVGGLWGQQARLHFSMQDVQHLLIDPDSVFGLRPRLLAADPEARHTGAFSFPIDNGAITISLKHRNGEVYRHVVEVKVEVAAS